MSFFTRHIFRGGSKIFLRKVAGTRNHQPIPVFSLYNLVPSRTLSAMLSPEDRATAISNLQSWTDVGDRDAITKTYQFKDFQQAWTFMSDIAVVAEEMNHHPEWFNVYNNVEVTLTTHDCNGVSQKVIRWRGPKFIVGVCSRNTQWRF